jgi:hypothetical protein
MEVETPPLSSSAAAACPRRFFRVCVEINRADPSLRQLPRRLALGMPHLPCVVGLAGRRRTAARGSNVRQAALMFHRPPNLIVNLHYAGWRAF